MKLSEFISNLEKAKKEHGDLNVTISEYRELEPEVDIMHCYKEKDAFDKSLIWIHIADKI